MRRAAFEGAPVPEVDCCITITRPLAFLSGTYPINVVRDATSYYTDGYRFAPAYKKRIYNKQLGTWQRAWDGKFHMFDIRMRSMPVGLVSLVVEALRKANPNARIQILDKWSETAPAAANDPSGFELNGIAFGQGKFDYQLAAAEAALKAKRCILKLATNSGKTEVAIAITKYLKVPTVFIVPGIDLLHQTRKRYAKRLGIPVDQIGIIGDDFFQVGQWITITTIDSLHARMAELRDSMQTFWQLMFVDECHTAGSDTFFEVLKSLHAYYRIGLSGTPLERSDGADLRLIAQTGEIAYEVTNAVLIERGISVPVEIEFKRVDEPRCFSTNWKTVQKQTIIDNENLNRDIVEWVPKKLAEGLQVLILVKEIAHGKLIEQRLQTVTDSVKFINGEEKTLVRTKALEDFDSGKLRCLVGTSILYQGIDTVAIDVIVFADLGKSRISSLQAIGRGLRTRPGKEKLLIRDYANFCHDWPQTHSLKRLKTYKAEKCFKLTVVT